MQQDENLKSLDEFIARLGGSNDAGRRSPGPNDFLVEHLQSARRSLLGSMPGEYRLNLQQAKESAASIPDKSDRIETKELLQSLIDWKAPKQPDPLPR